MKKETDHIIYYDNGVYQRLTSKGNEEQWNNQYDSLIEYIPSLVNGLYRIYFTWSSLLEGIYKGNFRDRYRPKLDLTKFLIDRDDEKDDEIDHKLDEAYKYAYEYFIKHPELSVISLLNDINKQMTFSTSKATERLVKDTLWRYRDEILQNPNDRQESLAQHLAWDAVCEFPFAYFHQLKDSEQEIIRRKTRKISQSLLRIFHDKYNEGIDLSSYRLADKISKELLSSTEYLEQIEERQNQGTLRIEVPHLLENKKDLVDADAIHFATFGFEGSPGIVITSDSRKVIEQRLVIQLSSMQFLCSLKNSKIKLSPGIILFADPQTCVIHDKLNVADIKEDATIDLAICKLSEGRKRSLVTFC